MKRALRHYGGGVPRDGKLCYVFENYPSPPDAPALAERWELYVRPEAGVLPWVNFKLIASQPTSHKGNYWFGWHSTKGRFNGFADTGRLKANRPQLFVSVEDACVWVIETYSDLRVATIEAGSSDYLKVYTLLPPVLNAIGDTQGSNSLNPVTPCEPPVIENRGSGTQAIGGESDDNSGEDLI